MILPPLHGHREVRALLARAVRHGSLPQSILIHGPAGVGKERLGLWLAQLLVCEEEAAEPCGSCQPCRLAAGLQHPDIHWFFPLPRPDSSSPEKLRDRLEEARGTRLQALREDPFLLPDFEKAPAHFLASVRTIQQLASLRPSMGARKAFLVGDAELMVPQESSQEAANAFLKLLEEPPPQTTLILTSSQPGALLPTIRSRLLAVRVGALHDGEVESLLALSGSATPDEAAALARRARGSLRRALRLAAAAREGEPESAGNAGRELLFAAVSDGAVARLAAAHDRKPAGARLELVGELDAFGEWLRDLAAVATGAPERISDPARLPTLRRVMDHRRVPVGGILAAIERVSRSRELALGNVNPQLIVADLLAGVQRDLRGEPSARRRTGS
jgi:DNA polymerase III subunit delta'